jgi:hypothetical protein
MADRTTKALLALIVLALWGLLLRPALTPVPTQAADDQPGQTMVVTNNGVYVFTRSGHVFLLDPFNLSVKARAIYGITQQDPVPTFRNNRP